jgi:RNA polymerase sigma-70 factor (ECF subfamily)
MFVSVPVVTKRPVAHLFSRPSTADESARYEQLVRGAVSGDRAAMERLLMRAQEVAFRFSLLVCGHPQDAEDVMQDALLKTYEHVARIEHPEAFRTWLFRTVRNACLMKRRRKVDEPAHVESIDAGEAPAAQDGGRHTSRIDIADAAKGPGDLAVNAWLGKRLRHALGQIAPADRMIVLMREMEGLSTREVSEITGFSEANVKQRLHRARVRLREHLGDL